MRNRYTKRNCVLLTTCAAALILTGCRSMPGAGMFGMRGEPSAAALAGSGPTTTYPAPPSASATPEAIASIAGGTAGTATKTAARTSPGAGTAQVAGFNVSPGYATPASNVASTNMAAAQANGIYDPGKSAFNGAPTAPKTSPTGYKPSGYSFGTKSTSSKTVGGPASASPEPSSSYAKASAAAGVSKDAASPAIGFTPPATSSYSTPASTPASGYTLPSDSPAVASITPPSASSAPTESEPESAFALPAASAPDFSTASVAPATAPSATIPSAATLDAPSGSSGGYMPGSTGSSSGYPSGDVTPTTTGSFYR